MSSLALKLIKAATLPAGQKAVLLALGWYSDDTGQNIYPSVPRIASETGLAMRSVQRHLRSLEQKGMIITRQHGGGRRATHYHLDFSAIGKAGEVSPVTKWHPSGDKMTPQGCQGVTLNRIDKDHKTYNSFTNNLPDQELWITTLNRMRDRIGLVKYDQWLHRSLMLSLEHDVLRIAVISRTAKLKIENDFISDIVSLAEVLRCEIEIITPRLYDQAMNDIRRKAGHKPSGQQAFLLPINGTQKKSGRLGQIINDIFAKKA